MADVKTMAAGAAATATGLAKGFIGGLSAQTAAGGNPAAFNWTMILTVIGIFMLIMGAMKGRPEAIMASLLVILLAPALASMINQTPTTPQPNQPPDNRPKNLLGGGGSPSGGSMTEQSGGERRTGGGTSEAGNELGLWWERPFLLMKAVVHYKDGSYRYIPEQSILDVDVSGGPLEVDRVDIFFIRNNLGTREVSRIEYKMDIKLDDQIINHIDQTLNIPQSEQRAGMWYVGSIYAKDLEPYLTGERELIIHTDYTVHWKVVFGLTESWGSGWLELRFRVAPGSVTQDSDLLGGGAGTEESILMSVVGGSPTGGVGLNTITSVMTLIFYAVMIYDVLRRR